MISNPLPGSPSTTMPTPEPSNSDGPLSSHPYDTSVLHKILSPISLAIFQPVFLFFRLALPSDNGSGMPIRDVSSALLLLVAYALGIAGLATSFATISASDATSQHSSDLKTGHGVAGLIFFVCLYGLVLGLFIMFLYFKRSGTLVSHVQNEKHKANRAASSDSPEKLDSVVGPSSSALQSVHHTSPPSSPRPRTNSCGPSSNLQEGRLSSDSESFGSVGPMRAFEVVNRHSRIRRTSGSWLVPPGEITSHQLTSGNLGDIDWLQRRRSLNAVVSQELLFVELVMSSSIF